MAVPLTLSSVPAQTPYVQYVSGSGQTVFPYPFEITQDSDLVCLINGVQQATDSGYTLSGQGTTVGGNLTFTVGQTAGTIITLYRNISIARITQLSQNGTFFSANFNNEYNRIYLIMQQLQQSLLPGGNQAFALMVPNSNNPAPATLLTPAAYKNSYLSFDANGNPQPAVLTSSGALTASLIASTMNGGSSSINSVNIGTPQTAQELAAGVTPTNVYYLPGNINRYGTNTIPGTTDMSAALTAALASNDTVYLPAAQGPYYSTFAGSFSMLAGQTLYGDGPSSILKTTYNAGSNIVMSDVVGAICRDFAIQITGFSSTTYVGAVAIIGGSTYCKVERMQISGNSGNGVMLNQANNCTIRDNSFTGVNLSAPLAQADIYLYGPSGSGCSYNVIDGNQCFGGGGFGIVLLTTTGSPHLYNVITNNRISGGNTVYGIANYSGAATVDNFNQIIGNYIENVTGAASTAYGAGIYVVGSGGDVIANNIIRNCCISTSATTLAPAGIGINGSSATTPVTISGNTVSGMTQYYGIYVTASSVGANIVGNTVLHPNSNTTGGPIAALDSSGINIQSNTIVSTSNQFGIQIYAQGANQANINISGNNVNAGSSNPVVLQIASSHTFTGVTICGNQLISTGAVNGILAESLINSAINGNVVNVGADAALELSACLATRVSGNSLVCSSATYAVITSGTCTGSMIDESNYYSATGGPALGAAAINNGGTGCNCRSFGSGSPGAGVAVAGDVSYNSAGASPVLYVYQSGSWVGLTIP